MSRAARSVSLQLGRLCMESAPERPQAPQEGGKKSEKGPQQALQSARLAKAEMLPHYQAQIEASNVDQQPLEDVGMTSKMGSAQSPGLIAVGKAAFDQLATLLHQPLASTAPDPAAVAVDRCFLSHLSQAAATTALRLRNIGPNADSRSREQHCIAVVPLIGHHLRHHLLAEPLRGPCVLSDITQN